MRRLVLLVAAAVGIAGGATALARAGAGDPAPPPAAAPSAPPPCQAPAAAGHQHAHTFPHPPDPRGGLAAAADGITLDLDRTELAAGTETPVELRLRRAGGTVPRLVPDGGVPMHVYLVRDDLGSYAHLHPTATADCGWQVRLRPPAPGRYRLFAAVHPEGRPESAPDLVLSRPLTVPGTPARAAPPAPAPAAVVRTPDGYTLTLRGYAAAGGESLLTVTVTRGGVPVRTLSPYLGAMAHLSAFRVGSLAFTHGHPLQPVADRGGPALTTPLLFPGAGDYRVFVQFADRGAVRTAAFTVPVR